MTHRDVKPDNIMQMEEMMSPLMVEAIRKEAFVQGFLRAHARSCGLALSDFTDEQLLSMLPNADEFYAAYRAERDPG